MATLTIRNVDEALKASLRVQAARHGQSMEEEVRAILRQALMPSRQAGRLGSQLVNRFRDVGGELPLPKRSLPRQPTLFDPPE
jgi:plasmid stability protein